MTKDVFIIIVSFGIALILETAVFALPLVLYLLLCLFIIKQNFTTVFIALLAGIIVDALSLRPLGVSSIFYLVCFIIILQYHRKFETATVPFALLAATVGGFMYLILFGSFMLLPQTIMGTIIAAVIYGIFTKTLVYESQKDKAYPTHLLKRST